MFLIEITNNLNGNKFKKVAETLEEINEFKDRNIANKVWGEPERWVHEDFATPEEIERAVENDYVDAGNGAGYVQYKLAADYTVEINESYIDPTVEYNKMVKDIFDEMEKISGTRNADSAKAFEDSMKRVVENPASWIEVGLIDDEGNLLDTEVKLTTYANQKLVEANDYYIFRAKRIQEFRAIVAGA